MEFGFELVCDQLRTCLRPDSVMEFGLKFLPRDATQCFGPVSVSPSICHKSEFYQNG